MPARNLQVETPLLSPSAGGALARPFLTRSWAWDTELALRIAPELFLKVRWCGWPLVGACVAVVCVTDSLPV